MASLQKLRYFARSVEQHLPDFGETEAEFDPTLLAAGCTHWFDPTDPATFTFSSADFISEWADKSGNDNHAVQATVADQMRRDGTVNGLEVVRSVDAGDCLVAPQTPDETRTIFLVFQRNDTDAADIDDVSGTIGAPQTLQSEAVTGLLQFLTAVP